MDPSWVLCTQALGLDCSVDTSKDLAEKSRAQNEIVELVRDPPNWGPARDQPRNRETLKVNAAI